MDDLAITPPFLLDALKTFTEGAISGLLLPCKPTKENTAPADRAADVYLMRLVKNSAAKESAPYIIHQIITTDDGLDERQRNKSEACVRSIFCVYSEDEQQGGLMLLNLMTRYKIALMQQVVIDKRFKLDVQKRVQSIIYPDDTAPFYAGEMAAYFELPAIERKVLI